MGKLPAYLSAAAFAAFALAGRAELPPEDAAAKRKEADRLFAAAQEICPVTGMTLGSMGEPRRAKSGERTVYLCCRSCLGEAMAPEHWKQTQKNLAEAQGVCPVMKKSLPENAASDVVEGRAIFVCCKPCIKKVTADPAKALALVEGQLKKRAASDRK
jgi:hypothetical protein